MNGEVEGAEGLLKSGEDGAGWRAVKETETVKNVRERVDR